jgi:predicted GIY-YIG superfamily endonuclease
MFRFVLAKKKIGQVYIIRNKLNDKVYIGLTTGSIKYRFNKHLYNALSSYKGGKLYVAMRKYGKDNFKVECLRICFSLKELSEQERLLIKQFDSYKNGYNSKPGGTLGGHYSGTKVTVNGINFQSLSQASKHYNVTYDSLISRLKYGWSIEEALKVKPRRRKPKKEYNITIAGNDFECMQDAAEHYGLPANRVRCRLWSGWSVEEALGIKTRGNKEPCLGNP